MHPLTSDQRKAVETVTCNVCVSAGAGTGKTSVLVERFLSLISNTLARSGEILAITFTEKAAQEMKSRIATRLKREGLEQARRELENAYIGTIHSFCSRILKEHPIEAGVDPEFRVLQEEEANLLKESALEELIESRFQEPEVFNLLRVYSDNEIREALKNFLEKINTGIASSPTAPPHYVIASEAKQSKVLEALKPLKSIANKESDCAELEAAISKSISNWQELEKIKEIGKRFQRRGKAQDQIELFRKALDEWMAAQAEQLGENYRKTFIDLASDFEAHYSALKAKRASLDFNDLERKALHLLSGEHPRSMACRNLYQKHFKFIMVDEFQDTSPLQDRLISLIARPDNLFIVGDWKQSIYGFRGSDSSVLFEKEKLFQQGTGQRVSLVENFRSRAEVLNEINSFFGSIWPGNIFEPLQASRDVMASKAQPDGAEHSVEFLVIDRKGDESMTEVRMNEARVLAKRISEMVTSGKYDYQDFAMLFRATTDIYFYEYELRNYGIPYYVVGGRGFYKQPEIRDIISFLELLENPHLDIPLAAVLRSPFVQISDDSLFWLAEHSSRLNPAKPFYEALLHFETIPEIKAEDKMKLEIFRSFLFQLLNEKEKWSISECIELIVERTKYDRYVLHLPQGKRHFANIRKLLEVAREVETREPVHLGDFIRYVKGLQTQEVRESEAQVEALEGNVVKLMTIHKAKGLEFKVVLLPDLNRKGEKRGGCFLMDSEYGIGFKVFNECTRKLEETWTYQKIKEKTIQNACQEAKRLLYVAMTRAKDHLILSGSSKGEEETNFGGFDEGANWFEWIRQWSASSAALKPQLVEVPSEKLGRHFLPLAEHKKIKSALQEGQPVKIKISEGTAQMIEFLKPIKPVYFERIDLPVSAYAVFKHAPEEFRKIYELGVLPEESLALAADDKSEEWSETEDEEVGILNAADFGTVIHKIFEHLVAEPEKAPSKLKFWLEYFQKNVHASTFQEVKNLSNLFLKSQQFLEIKSAKKRYPELPFVLRLHHGIIQGTLDLLYQNSRGDWVIVDYKTSVIARSEATKQSKTEIASTSIGSPFCNDDDLRVHADRYQGQMLLYALACYELLKIKPKTASLYFVRVDRSYEFSLADVDFKQLRQEFEALQKQILKISSV